MTTFSPYGSRRTNNQAAFADTPADTPAERQRLNEAREAAMEAERAKSFVEVSKPILDAADYLIGRLGMAEVPNISRILKNTTPAQMRRVCEIMERRHALAVVEATRASEIKTAHDSLVRRQAELNAGTL